MAQDDGHAQGNQLRSQLGQRQLVLDFAQLAPVPQHQNAQAVQFIKGKAQGSLMAFTSTP